MNTSVPQNACGASKNKAWQTDQQMDDGQSDPYVVLCFAGATIKFNFEKSNRRGFQIS